MKKDISVFSKYGPARSYDVVIGTHSGIFHADEVVAISLLHLYYQDESIAIVRTRDSKELLKCDLLVDIGGGELDHHQPGGNGSRQNGVKYASAGLVWKKYGDKIVANLANKVDKLEHSEISTVTSQIDDYYIQAVDEIDNGVYCDDSIFSYIEAFLPSWNNTDNDAFNKEFSKVVKITTSILERLIYKSIDSEYSFNWVVSRLRQEYNRIFEIPAQTFPWQYPILLCNGCYYQAVDFVIFPYPDGGWAAQCVPPSMTKQFEKRIPFPHAWAGQTDKLPEISGIPGATFCHNNCFFVRGETKETVIEMCKKAIKIFENPKSSDDSEK